MATTIPKMPTCSRVDCPPESDLEELIGAGDTPIDSFDRITEHVGECESCQKRLGQRCHAGGEDEFVVA